jgi:hypothetical protein
MKRLWWVLGVIAFGVLMYFTALPGDFAVGREGPSGLAGTYTVNGVDPTGLEYSGTLIVNETGTDAYALEWIITGSILTGSGTRVGNELIAEWESVAAAGPGRGTVTYVIGSDGTMSGVRTVDGFDDPGTEEIFPEA